jgi:hypothetical protein
LINGHASDLHPRKHLNEGQLNLAIEAKGARLTQLFGKGAARRTRDERGEDRLLQRLKPVREISTESRRGDLNETRVAHRDIRNPGAERYIIHKVGRSFGSNAHHCSNETFYAEAGKFTVRTRKALQQRMHHSAIVGGENRSRVIDNRDCQFCLWATPIRTHTADRKVPLC